MEIVIGAAPRVGQPNQPVDTRGGFVEAQVLNIRPPRRRRDGPRTGHPDRRDRSHEHDPASGRVLLLLVPEGYHVPKDLGTGNYRVFLRFAPKRK
jgi:hypothetical protein